MESSNHLAAKDHLHATSTSLSYAYEGQLHEIAKKLPSPLKFTKDNDIYTLQNFTEQKSIDPPSQKTLLWSIYDSSLPAPQPASIFWPMRCLMWLADGILDRCPSVVQQVAWSYLSASSHPRPKKGLVSGEFEALSQVGIFRFLLDKIAPENSLHKDAWVHFRIGPVPMKMPLSPKDAMEVLKSEHVKRGFAYERLVEFFGYGIFTSRMFARWKEQRKVARCLFFHKALTHIAPSMHEGLVGEARRASKVARNQPVDLVLLLSRMGLFAFCDSMLGVDVRDIADELAPAVNCVLAYINGALEPLSIPFGTAYQAFIKNKNIVHDWMQVVIARVRQNASCGLGPQNPLIDKILQLQSNQEQEELVELMIAMVLGGHETTARLMLGAIYGLLRHPHYIEHIRNELQAFKNEKSKQHADWRLSCTDQKALPRLHTIIDEALRLFPPVWLVARTPTCDITVHGQTVHKNTEILINFLLLHRLKCIWGDNAEEFYPERFDHLQAKDKKHFFPFAVGPQRCPGDHFARLEAVLAIAGLFENFDITLANSDQLPCPTSAGTFRLFQELKVFLVAR